MVVGVVEQASGLGGAGAVVRARAVVLTDRAGALRGAGCLAVGCVLVADGSDSSPFTVSLLAADLPSVFISSTSDLKMRIERPRRAPRLGVA